MGKLGDFADLFDVRVAVTPEEIAASQRLRYQIYCQERRMLDPTQLDAAERDGLQEADPHDLFSEHCIVSLRRTSELVGCVRVVTTDHGCRYLPLQVHGNDSLYDGQFHPERIGQEKICEISRFAIPRNVRDLCNESEASLLLSMATALKVAPFAVLEGIGIEHAYVTMKPALDRMLQRVGLDFQRIGDMTNYPDGQRAAYHITHTKGVLGMNPELRDMYAYTQEVFAGSVGPKPKRTPKIYGPATKRELGLVL